MVGNWVLDQQFLCDEKRANKFRRATFINIFGFIFFYYSASGLVDLATVYLVRTLSHIYDYFVCTIDNTNIHFYHGLILKRSDVGIYFLQVIYLFGRRAAVLETDPKKSGQDQKLTNNKKSTVLELSL